MIRIPATETDPIIWINPANINLTYQFDDRLVVVFGDKSRLTLSGESMAIVVEEFKKTQINYQPIPDLNEILD
jgi:hypothetical protein